MSDRDRGQNVDFRPIQRQHPGEARERARLERDSERDRHKQARLDKNAAEMFRRHQRRMIEEMEQNKVDLQAEAERKERNRQRWAWPHNALSDSEYAQKWERELLPAFRAKQPSEPTEADIIAAKRRDRRYQM